MDALEEALLGVSVPDTAVIQRSEAQLRVLLKGRASLFKLLHLLVNSQHDAVRQLCAVLLRVKINQAWIKLSPQEQAQAKATLLSSLIKDPSRLVRVNVCYVVAILSRHQLNEWPELLATIEHAVASPMEDARELGFLLLFTLSESLATSVTDKLEGICKLYYNALVNETVPKVRTSALRAAASLVEALDTSSSKELGYLEPLIEPLLNSALNEVDEETCVLVVEVLAAILASPLVDDHVAITAKTLLQLCVAPERPSSVRSAACSALCDLIEARPRAVAKNAELLNAIFLAVDLLAKETLEENPFSDAPEVEQSDEDEGSDELTVRQMVETLVDTLCAHISAKKTQPLLQLAGRMAASQDKTDRGLLIMCVAIEGLADELHKDVNALRALLSLVLRCTAADRLPGTRFLACMTLNQLVENLGVETGELHGEIMPCLLPMLHDVHSRVRKAAAFVVGELCSQLDADEIQPYLAPLVDALLGRFSSPTLTIQDASESLRMLASIAGSARGAFAPHLARCLQVTAPLVSGEQQLEVRAYATALMGELAVAAKECGDAAFFTHVPALLDTAMAGLQLDSLELREAVFGLCAHLALALGSQLDPMAPRILTVLLEGCVADDGDLVDHVHDRMGGLAVVPASIRQLALGSGDDDDDNVDRGQARMNDNAGNDEEEDDEDYEVPGAKVLTSVRTLAADCKVACLFAMETVLESCSPNVGLAFVDSIVNVSQRISDYPHPQVRAGVLSVLAQSLLVIHKGSPLPPPDPALVLAYAQRTRSEKDLDLGWLPGMVPPGGSDVVERVMDHTVRPLLMSAMLKDSNKEVAARACDCWTLILTQAGPRAVGDADDADGLVSGLLDILHGLAMCSGTADEAYMGGGGDDNDDGEDGDEDVAKFDSVLADSACEALGSVAKALGEKFAPHRPAVLSLMLKRCKPSMPPADRVTALGVLVSVVLASGAEPTWADRMFKAARLAAEQIEDAPVRRNAVFLLGVLVDLRLVADVQTVLGIIRPMFTNPGGRNAFKWDQEDQAAVVDNACGAVARIVTKLPRGAMVETVSAALVQFLPLREDHEEDWVVYEAMAGALPSLSAATKRALQTKATKALNDVDVKSRMARQALEKILSA